ncbi:hypothetical protein DJ031_04685 [bacterium endosymbiont of Escarpia laminata]|nr:MAG: hypothetical protein DJ031_04685 [bacterium endosymbiont of Escarpia laminata]
MGDSTNTWSSITLASSGAIDFAGPQHISITRDGTTGECRTYIDGGAAIIASSTTNGTYVGPNTKSALACDMDVEVANECYRGGMQHVAVWENQVMTAAEAARLNPF